VRFNHLQLEGPAVRLTPGLVACALLVAADDRGRDINTDTKLGSPLEGVWTITSVRLVGQDLEAWNGTTYAFKGNRLTMKSPEGDNVLTYTVETSRTPAAIDLKHQAGPRRGESIKCIYAVRGDTLRLCRSTRPEEERPEDFTADKPGEVLVVLKRR
jgi:uncharacterized protein (TIGR03067 family)